jgi:hypothetical protein
VSYLDAAFGMLNLLLTTEEAGGGWIDQGRVVRPPADLSFLCPEGLAVLETPGSTPAIEVGTMLRPDGPDGSPDLGLWIDQTVMLPGDDADLFAIWVATLDACAGTDPWQAPDWGMAAVERLETPALGDESAAFRMTMDEGTAEPCWLEARLFLAKIGPLLVSVEAGALLESDDTASSVDDAEWVRVAEAAVTKAAEAMAEAPPSFVVGDPDAESDLTISLLDGLLTTGEIGGGWIDQGRIAIPSGGSPREGTTVLCPDGAVIAESLGSRLDPKVTTRYRQEPPPAAGGFVWEAITAGEATQIAADFATWVDAMDACAGVDAWETPDAGPVSIDRLDGPAFGEQSAGYAVLIGDGSNGDPWLEMHLVSVLVAADGYARVLDLSTTVVHDQSTVTIPRIDDDELARIAAVAVEKLRES